MGGLIIRNLLKLFVEEYTLIDVWSRGFKLENWGFIGPSLVEVSAPAQLNGSVYWYPSLYGLTGIVRFSISWFEIFTEITVNQNVILPAFLSPSLSNQFYIVDLDVLAGEVEDVLSFLGLNIELKCSGVEVFGKYLSQLGSIPYDHKIVFFKSNSLFGSVVELEGEFVGQSIMLSEGQAVQGSHKGNKEKDSIH